MVKRKKKSLLDYLKKWEVVVIFFKTLSAYRYILLLAVLSIGFLASIVRYSLRTYYVPVWDDQHFIYMAAEYYRLLKNPTLDTLYQMMRIIPYRQPGYSLLILPFLIVFGLSNSLFWGLFTNGLLHVASIFGVYIISRNYLTRLASFLAAFIFAFYGWTLYFAHFTYSETATSALTIWTVLFLIKSRFFQSRKYSILFGLLLGLGLLTRWVTIVFISGPLLYSFYHIIKNQIFRKKIILNFVISFSTAFMVSFYPYYINARWLLSYFTEHRVGGEIWNILAESDRNLFSLYSLTFYLHSFMQLGFLFFLLIVAGVLLSFKKSSKLKLILLAVVIPWGFFSFFSIIKGDRYIVPIYPYLAILSAGVFDFIKNKKYKFLLIIITVFLSICTFLGTVWGKGPMSKNLQTVTVPLPYNLSFNVYLTAISRPPNIYKSNGEEVIEYIKKDAEINKIKKPLILELFYYHPLNNRIEAYNTYNLEESLNIYNFTGLIIENPEEQTNHLINGVINKADYILIKTGERTDDYFQRKNYKTLKSVLYLFDNYLSVQDYYEEIAKIWIYQDSSEVRILKKKNEINDQELKEMEVTLIRLLKITSE